MKTAWILGDKGTEKAGRGKWVLNIDNMIGVHPEIVLDKLRKAWRSRPELLEEVAHTSGSA